MFPESLLESRSVHNRLDQHEAQLHRLQKDVAELKLSIEAERQENHEFRKIMMSYLKDQGMPLAFDTKSMFDSDGGSGTSHVSGGEPIFNSTMGGGIGFNPGDASGNFFESSGEMPVPSISTSTQHKSDDDRVDMTGDMGSLVFLVRQPPMKDLEKQEKGFVVKLFEQIGLPMVFSLLEVEDLAVQVTANLAVAAITQEQIVEVGGLTSLLILLTCCGDENLNRVSAEECSMKNKDERSREKSGSSKAEDAVRKLWMVPWRASTIKDATGCFWERGNDDIEEMVTGTIVELRTCRVRTDHRQNHQIFDLEHCWILLETSLEDKTFSKARVMIGINYLESKRG